MMDRDGPIRNCIPFILPLAYFYSRGMLGLFGETNIIHSTLPFEYKCNDLLPPVTWFCLLVCAFAEVTDLSAEPLFLSCNVNSFSPKEKFFYCLRKTMQRFFKI